MNAPAQNMPAQSPAKAFQVYMNKYKSQLEMALPKHLTVDRMMRLSLTAFSQNPKLQQCSSNSIFSSIIIASQLGLEPGVNGQGYLVPYKDTCTFIPGWKGLVDLAQRGGRASVWTGAVYEGDEFDYMLGDSPYCRHKPCGEFDVEKLTHVYAIGRVKDSEMPIIEVWPVKKVRSHFVKTVVKGLQPNHYSHKHFEAYARKVALLQVLKYMPQSIELSNAMDVSHAQESGKGVTIDGDFVNVENTQQQNEQAQNVQNSTVNDDNNQVAQIADVQTLDHQEQVEEDYAPTFAQIKRSILTAKSPAHIDVIEEQAMDHANKDERKQLMALVKAQSEKFKAPVTEAAPVKKPEAKAEPVVEPEPVIEVKAEPKPEPKTKRTPTVVEEVKAEVVVDEDVIRAQLLSDLLENVKNAKTPAEANAQVRYTRSWTEEQRKPLMSAISKRLSELNSQSKPLNERISESKTVDELDALLPELRALQGESGHAMLTLYTQRKEILSQQDIFGESQPEVSYVDAVIARIKVAKNQDDINAEYSDPTFDELSDQEKAEIDYAAQQRETELQG